AQRAHELAILYLMIGCRIDGGGKMGMKEGLAGTRLGAVQPVERDAVGALEIIGVAQLRRVVAIERDHQRALAPQLDALPGGGFELGGESRPGELARAIERVQRQFAGLGLDPGGEHAGRGPARALAGFAALEDLDRAARLGEAPADAQTDDAAADNRGLGALQKGLVLHGLPSLALPRQVRWV